MRLSAPTGFQYGFRPPLRQSDESMFYVEARWTPRQRVLAECERRGVVAVVTGCNNLLARARPVDVGLVAVLGGNAAQVVLNGGEGGLEGYWPRVWATRGLLYVWDDSAVDAIAAACADDAWRVREMAAKVIARPSCGSGIRPCCCPT